MHNIRLPDDSTVGPIATFDRIENIKAVGHASHDGVLTIQEVTFIEHDEKLAVGTVGALRPRHAHDTTVKRDIGELGRQIRLVRAATTSAAEVRTHLAVLHVTRLRHETFNHSVKHNVVIGPALGETCDTFGVRGGDVFEEIDDDCAICFTRHDNLDTRRQSGARAQASGQKCLLKHQPQPSQKSSGPVRPVARHG